MLNLSNNKVDGKVNKAQYLSFKIIRESKPSKVIARLMLGSFAIFIISMFIPWTQNIQSSGQLTTLYPAERPQTIQSIIPGAIQKWYVREGVQVKKGDTILVITEIKEDYFDPKLLERTQEQIVAKENAARAYNQKNNAIQQQIYALTEGQKVKLEQTKNKIEQAKFKILADSAQLAAYKAEYQVAEYQFRRMDTLYQKGLKALTDFESKRVKLQEVSAKLETAQNKLSISKNELAVYQQDLDAIVQEYADKIAKSQSDISSTSSTIFATEGEIAKMKNSLANYSIRNGYYYITAPQDGIITKTIKAGIGETINTGDELVSIMPLNIHLAAEVYVKPMDLPLLKTNVKVRLTFDGWPAIVFSGWPGTSFGTFGGRILAVDNFPSYNGLFRVLVQPDIEEKEWPKQLRVGSGARSIMLLNDVPLGYELWRQLNGFPPEYYQGTLTNKSNSKSKTIEK